jgi:hypothetical protein
MGKPVGADAAHQTGVHQATVNMQQRHYALIAQSLAAHRATGKDGGQEAHNALVDRFVDSIGAHNKNFRPDLFRTQAGYKKGGANVGTSPA